MLRNAVPWGARKGPQLTVCKEVGTPAHGCEEPNFASNLNGQGSEVSPRRAREELAILPAP